MKIEYSVDGGFTWLEAKQALQVSVTGFTLPGEDGKGMIVFNLTGEGVITYVWRLAQYDQDQDYNMAISSEFYEDLIHRMIEEDA